MLVSQVDRETFSNKLKTGTLRLDLSLCSFQIQSDMPLVCDNLYRLYANHHVLGEDHAVDFHLRLSRPTSIRRWLKPQVEFWNDDVKPFRPFPAAHAYSFLEWGMNWCVASQKHDVLLIHASVLAKGDKAILFPAPPGSGKSTLCTYLAFNGWRLLSDEMAVVDLVDGTIKAFPRAICLKNQSINLCRQWFPQAQISHIARDTKKGDVAHVRPPLDAIENAACPAVARAIVFPTFSAGQTLQISTLTKTETFMELARNAFNHNALGGEGFSALSRVIEGAEGYQATYSDLSALREFLDAVLESS